MKKHFTLIELLIVVSIIAILASLLLPSLSKARQKAKTTQCISNQKQLMAITILYAEDNKGLQPCFYDTETWGAKLLRLKYVNSLKPFVCSAYAPYGKTLDTSRTYSMRNSPTPVSNRYKILSPNILAYAPTKVYFLRPSKFILYTDSYRNNPADSNEHPEGNQFYWFNLSYTSFSSTNSAGMAYAVHQPNTLVAAFADGHVANAGQALLGENFIQAFLQYNTRIAIPNPITW